MFRFSIRELMLVTAVVGLALGWFIEHRQFASTRQQWEYKAIPFQTGQVDYTHPNGIRASGINDFNKAGGEGWEFVTVSEERVAYFRRQK